MINVYPIPTDILIARMIEITRLPGIIWILSIQAAVIIGFLFAMNNLDFGRVFNYIFLLSVVILGGDIARLAIFDGPLVRPVTAPGSVTGSAYWWDSLLVVYIAIFVSYFINKMAHSSHAKLLRVIGMKLQGFSSYMYRLADDTTDGKQEKLILEVAKKQTDVDALTAQICANIAGNKEPTVAMAEFDRAIKKMEQCRQLVHSKSVVINAES